MEETTGRPPLPPKVAAAIAEVMKNVPKLGKGEKNNHADYKFASIDAFLEAVGPLCAQAGLLIVQDEDECDVIEGGWLRIKYSFTLAHSSGETWAHRPVRSMMVRANMGPQAFGAAQSYALKQFERSLLQIATGDKEDADTHPKDELPKSPGNASVRAQRGGKANGNGAAIKVEAPKEPGSIAVPIPEADADMPKVWRSWSETMAGKIAQAADHAEAEAWLKANDMQLKNLAAFSDTGKKWADTIRQRVADKREKEVA